jgi:hypothetical protein
VHMLVRRLTAFAIALTLSLTAVSFATSQETKSRRGRKYKAPAATSHVEVLVLRENNGKPLTNAAVIFHPIKDGKDEGNLEVKTNADGKAIIDIIPTGSSVGVQVIADGFATYAGDYLVSESSRDIVIKMLKPQAQISTYEETHGKASDRPVGVQEPRKPSTPPVVQAPQPTNHTSDPNPLAPVGPNATPGNSQNRTPQ